MNFLIYEENFILFFFSVHTSIRRTCLSLTSLEIQVHRMIFRVTLFDKHEHKYRNIFRKKVNASLKVNIDYFCNFSDDFSLLS
jgi:hypothetical protein